MDLEEQNFCEGPPGGRGSAVRDPEIQLRLGRVVFLVIPTGMQKRLFPRSAKGNITGEERSHCHQYLHRSSSPSFLLASVEPVTGNFHKRRNARSEQDLSTGHTDKKENKKGRMTGGEGGQRGRGGILSTLEGTVDPGGLDVPAPPRARALPRPSESGILLSTRSHVRVRQ